MVPGEPSRTAWRVATQRAAHQIYDDPKIFVDPLALKIIGKRGERHLRESEHRRNSFISRKLRSMFAIRSRFCEEAMAEAVGRGIEQIVILGAGLDTFAYRSPLATRVKVFEVDHPSTQAWKRQQLVDAGIQLPASLAFVPIDFETTTLAEGLAGANVELSGPTFFSWLGVVFYVPWEATQSTLGFVSGATPGSEIVFDYIVSPATLDAVGQRGFAHLSRMVANIGEPWRNFYEPEALAADLRRLGFGTIEDFAVEALARKFAGQGDGLEPFRWARVVRAKVGGTEVPTI